jgi:signal peptidase I
VTWNYCQVYREPSWYANKPEPGPGFRLLEKFPDEELKPGDEYFDRLTTTWRRSTNAKAGMPQPEKVWYRRRIEPVEPVDSKPLLIRRWTVDPGDEIKLPNGRLLIINQDGFEVTQ